MSRIPRVAAVALTALLLIPASGVVAADPSPVPVVLEPTPAPSPIGVAGNETASAIPGAGLLGVTWDEVFVGTAKADDYSGGSRPGPHQRQGRR